MMLFYVRLLSRILVYLVWSQIFEHSKNENHESGMPKTSSNLQKWQILYLISSGFIWTCCGLHVIASEASCNLCYVLSISTVCWNSLKSLGHLERNWAHHGTDTRAFLLLHSLYCFFLNFCLWQSSAHGDLNLNMNIQSPTHTVLKHLRIWLMFWSGIWVGNCMGSDFIYCIAFIWSWHSDSKFTSAVHYIFCFHWHGCGLFSRLSNRVHKHAAVPFLRILLTEYWASKCAV